VHTRWQPHLLNYVLLLPVQVTTTPQATRHQPQSSSSATLMSLGRMKAVACALPRA
jgi:hypothetical protein